MMTLEERARLKDRLRSFFEERESLLIAYLFGSALRDDTYRDLDVAILCTPEFSKTEDAFGRVLRWGSELESFIQPRIEVDLRWLDEAPVHFQHEVIQKGYLLFERDRDARVLFEAEVLTKHLDYEPTRRFFNERLISRWKS